MATVGADVYPLPGLLMAIRPTDPIETTELASQLDKPLSGSPIIRRSFFHWAESTFALLRFPAPVTETITLLIRLYACALPFA